MVYFFTNFEIYDLFHDLIYTIMAFESGTARVRKELSYSTLVQNDHYFSFFRSVRTSVCILCFISESLNAC